MPTFAASLANSIAVARPMPALPPVISATFPSNWFILSPSLRSGATYPHPPRNVDVDFKHRTTDAAFRREHFCQRSAVNGCAALWDFGTCRSAVYGTPRGPSGRGQGGQSGVGQRLIAGGAVNFGASRRAS